MKTYARIVLPAAALLLASCYAELDAPSVQVKQAIATDIPGLPATQFNLPCPGLGCLISAEFQLGEVAVDESEKDSRLELNSAAVEMTTASAMDFRGVTEAKLKLLPPAGSALPAVDIAVYRTAAAGTGPAVGTLSADGRTITLAATEKPNLLPYLHTQTLTLNLSGSGTPPGPVGAGTWQPTITLDFRILAHKALP
jgi:hypothetical protein